MALLYFRLIQQKRRTIDSVIPRMKKEVQELLDKYGYDGYGNIIDEEKASHTLKPIIVSD
jgi:putative aminopeptidase FrvX